MQTSLGKNVLLIHREDVGIKDLSTFYVVAHGDQLSTQFGLDKRLTLYFPWGVGQFGWYHQDNGFPLYDIMRKERRSIRQGLTQPTRKEVVGVEGTGQGITSPLLHYDEITTPDIKLVAKDLDAAFCERMLKTYYHDAREDRYPTHVGIVCLEKTSWTMTVEKKLSEVLAQLLPSLCSYTDVMVYCLCCSVEEGGEHRATVEAEGYVSL